MLGDDVVLALGANIAGPWGSPRETLARAIGEIALLGVKRMTVSSLYQTAPVGGIAQPAFVNAVMTGETTLAPETLIERLHTIEARAGRVRPGIKNGPRSLDLDILDFGGRVLGRDHDGDGLVLPHSRLHERVFVLLPLAEIAPGWRHPLSCKSAAELLQALPRSDGDLRKL